MIIREIRYDSSEYKEAWQIREETLRKPLGRSLADEDLSDESDAAINTHLVAIDHAEQVVGTLIMTRANRYNIRIRQVAIAQDRQGQGIGRQLMRHAETLATARNALKLFLHARVPVRDFYLKLGYKVTSEEYAELGIPHVTMEKAL